MSTFEKVQALFAEQFECDPATITMDTDMVEDLGADSLDVVELSMTVEDEFGITVFANINLRDFGRPEVVAFEEEGEVVEGLDMACLDKARDERQLDGCAKLGRHHGAIAIDVEIGHGVSVAGIDKRRALDTHDGIALFDVDAQKAIGRVIARSMANQTVLFLDVLGKFKSINLGVCLTLEAESRLAFDELAYTGLGDEVGIVARIVDGNEHATIAGFVAPEAIEVAGSQQVA